MSMPPGCRAEFDDNGGLDEFSVVEPDSVTLERLGNGHWQLRVFVQGAQQAVYVEIAAVARRGHVRARMEVNP
jgi:hypothetical protein